MTDDTDAELARLRATLKALTWTPVKNPADARRRAYLWHELGRLVAERDLKLQQEEN